MSIKRKVFRVASWAIGALLVASVAMAAVGWRVDSAGNLYKNGYKLSLPSISANSVIATSDQIAPIGSIIPFYDFNGALTFNASFWHYCDGTADVAFAGIANQTVPDASNRYLVGFGTEAGGDIDTAAWATTIVGAASHQVDLSHTHTGPSHAHGAGTLQFETLYRDGQFALYGFASDGSSSQMTGYDSGEVSAGTYYYVTYWNNTDTTYYTKSGAGSTASGGTGATGSTLSSTQSVQPRSVQVRYLIRTH